jgi:hypothetical protein
VWLYHCFSLSLREVETIRAQRGIVVSHESGQMQTEGALQPGAAGAARLPSGTRAIRRTTGPLRSTIKPPERLRRDRQAPYQPCLLFSGESHTAPKIADGPGQPGQTGE